MASDVLETPEQLIARCAAGEAEALHRLYDNTASQLFGLLVRILSRDDLAQEALQDVYVSIWRNAARYNARKGAAFTWMVSIARYRAIDIKRSRKREINAGDMAEQYPADADASLSQAYSDPFAATAQDADAKRLDECLKQLQATQRTAVCLAYLRGLTHSEVAESLQAPLGTIKSWIRRGLESLKECLQP